MSISNNFPTIAPSLLLDFANTKTLDNRIAFNRTTTATYYDGKTVAKAEENLIQQSQAFDQGASWAVASSSVTANSVAAPDGTTTADTLTASAANAEHSILSTTFPATNGQRFVVSVFAKKNTNDFVQLAVGNQAGTYANFNLATGAAGTSAGVVSTAITETPTGSGWYRISMVFDYSSSVTSSLYVVIVDSSSALRRAAFNAAGTEAVYLWRAQVEQRSALSAYTATTTQPITNYVPVLLTAAAGQPRFDHNPTTGESLGLLVEEQRTNLALQSEDFSTTWSLGSVTVETNLWVTPNGTLTGDICTIGTDSTVPGQAITVANSTTYTLSFYYHKTLTTAAFFRLRFGTAGGSVSGFIDVANGTFGSLSSGITAGTITHVGNNVYRAWVTMTYGASDAGARTFAISGTTTNNSATPDTGKKLAIWGVQFEQGAFPTSYIPTTAASATRNADAASMTGTNFTSWFDQQEGTLYAEYVLGLDSVSAGIFLVDDGTASNNISIRYASGSQAQYSVSTNGVSQVNLAPSGYSAAGTYKRSCVYANNSFQQAINGALPSSEDTSGTIPVVNTARIGSENSSGANAINGTIKKIAYYPIRCTNTQLQALTS